MKSIRTAALACAVFVVLLPHPARAEAPSSFVFSSAPESYIGAGAAFTLTAPDTVFTVESYNANSWFDIRMWTGLDYWNVRVTAPNGVPLALGTYNAPTQVPNSSTPSLFLTGNNRADSFETGVFSILDLAFDSAGAVASLALDFVEFDNVAPGQWNEGQIRFNSDVPVAAVPEPSTVLLLALGLAGIALGRRRTVNRDR